MPKLTTRKYRITFLEEVLGTSAADKELYETYIASKSPDAATTTEEIEALGEREVIEKAMTIFPRNAAGEPIFWDYQWRGFFKESCKFLRKVKDSESSKLKAYKQQIDGLIFVFPREIAIKFEGEIGNCQRPLRASTPQGERVALSNSEAVPAGAVCEFEVGCYCEDDFKLVEEWLDYGTVHGMGQWRNSGKGTFNWEEI